LRRSPAEAIAPFVTAWMGIQSAVEAFTLASNHGESDKVQPAIANG
jgi:hypothetical protein